MQREKQGKTLEDIGKAFLNRIPVVQEMMLTIDKQDHMKLKSVYSTKTPYRNGGKFVSYTFDLELTSRITSRTFKNS